MVLSSKLGRLNWYPNNKSELINALDHYLSHGISYESHHIQAIICPHAGYKYCGPVIGHAMAAIKDQAIKHVIILGPSHQSPLKNSFITPLSSIFQTEIGRSRVNKAFIENISTIEGHQENDELFETEHSIWMMLPFIQHLHPDTLITPIITGSLNRKQTQSLASTITNIYSNETLIIISSDFTHYGHAFNYMPFTANIAQEIKSIDRTAFQFIINKDSDGFWNWYHSNQTTICGRYCISILLEFMNKNHHVMDSHYLQSGQLTSDWTHSVSYKSAIIGVETL